MQWLDELGQIGSDNPPGAIAVVLRHGATGRMPESKHALFTKEDEKYAVQLGRQLGEVLDLTGLRLLEARSSVYPHTVSTCEALLSGAGIELAVNEDPLLGNPSIFVKDGNAAKKIFKEQGHDYCAEALMRGKSIPGWSVDSGADSRALLTHLFESIPKQNGVGLFVSHDIVIGTMVSRCLGNQLKLEELPGPLEGAVFMPNGEGSIEVSCCAYSGNCKWEL